MPKTYRRLKTGSKAWIASLKAEVLASCPPMIECPRCGRVGRDGYVCFFCQYDGGADADDIIPEEWL